MPRVSPIQTNFNAGRLSRRLEGRVDLAKYANGCRVLQNFIPQIQGAAEKRPGTRYVADADQGPLAPGQPNAHVRLIPFEFSTDDAYILELTNGKMRFYRNSGRIIAPTLVFAASTIDAVKDHIELGTVRHYLIDEQGPFHITTDGTLPALLPAATDLFIVNKNMATKTFLPGDVDFSPNESITITAHGYRADEGPFNVTTTGTLPGGIVAGRNYWIGFSSVDVIKLREDADRPSGPVVNLTDGGTGVHSIVSVQGNDAFRFQLSLTAGGVAINTDQGSGTHTLTPQNDIPHELLTPYNGDLFPFDAPSSEIFDLQFTQSADVMYIAQKGTTPRKLTRTDHTEWILEEVAFDWVPFIPENADDDLNVVSTGETGSVSLCSPDGIFKAAHVGGFFKQRVQVGGNYAKWVSGGVSTTTTNIYQNFENEILAAGARAEHEGNVYEIVDTNGNTGTGTAAPIHKIGMQFDGRLHWKFLHSGAGYLRIDTFINANRVLATVIKQIPRAAVSTLLISNITKAATALVTTSAVNDVETGDEVFIFGVVGMTEVNERTFRVTRMSTTTFQLDGEDSLGHTDYISGGNVPITRSGDLAQSNTDNTKQQTDLWSLGAWSTEFGFPRTVTFYEDRLWFAGSTANPQTLWASRTGDFENHEITDEDESALIFTLSTDKVNVIEWISPGKVLAIGTAGGEFIASASSLEEALTPDNIRIVRHSNYGSRAGVMPLRIEQVVLFVQRSGGRIRELVFDFDTDSFVAPDLAVLADDLFLQTEPTTPVAQKQDKAGAPRTMAFQQEPNRTVWVSLDSGDLLSMTYDRAQQVVGWHTHQIGPVDIALGPWSVQSVAVIPHPLGDSDQVWLAVRTGASPAAKVFIMFIEKPWHAGRSLEDAFYVDAGLTYDPSPPATETTFTGLDHLDGKTVQVLADGIRRDDEVVASGSVTIDAPAVNVAQIGLVYDSILQTMRFEGGSNEGTAQGKIKRITKFVVRLFQTGLGLRYGAEDDALLEDVPQMAAVTAADLKDGDTDALAWPKGYEQAGRVLLKHSTPLPCTVVAIMPQISVQDR